MKKALLTLSFLIPVMTHAQTFVTEKDPQSADGIILKGQCHYSDLLAQPSFAWMKTAERYRTDGRAMEVLKQELPNYELAVFFGSWCEDSHLQLPRLYKVLQEAKMPPEKVTLYGMDRAKKGRDAEDRIFRIERVPTIILIQKHKEIGRIVETPQKSIETDLAEMIENRK